MASGKEIRTQINTIKKTQKITRAMEMVAASKMRRAQDRMETSRPYAREIYRVIGHLARSHSEYHHPYLLHRDVKRVGYIIITTDRGLCGGLNSNLFRTMVRDFANWHQKETPLDICVVGTKGEHFFKRYGGNIVAVTTHLGDAPEQNTLNGFVKIMLDEYREGKIDALYLCYNEFVTTMSQKPVIKPLLPLPLGEEVKQDHWDYIYEPDSKVLLDKLFDRYIEQQVYQAVVENNASEQAARMVAMKSASENAGELIDELQLAYNKARQAAITKELAEIVGGAAAV